jgi:hypothetical protein
MLQRHLDITPGEVVGRLNKDWAGDIRSYDTNHEHMLMFSVMLTEGIAKQFPIRSVHWWMFCKSRTIAERWGRVWVYRAQSRGGGCLKRR